MVDFLLYIHGKQLRSCQYVSFILTTLYQGKRPRGILPVLSVQYFDIHLTTALLESAEEEEWAQKYFYDQIFVKECAGHREISTDCISSIIATALGTQCAGR